MDASEFDERLTRLVANGRLTRAQANDWRQQWQLFDAARTVNERDNSRRVVGYCAGKRFVGDALFDWRGQIDRTPDLKDRQLYFEDLAGGEADR